MATETRPPALAEEPQGTVLRGISWKDYLRLRDNPENYHVRMSYLDGTLILMSPQFIHDKSGRRLGAGHRHGRHGSPDSLPGHGHLDPPPRRARPSEGERQGARLRLLLPRE